MTQFAQDRGQWHLNVTVLKTVCGSASRHGGPSAPGELVEEWWLRVASNGGFEWRRLLATNGVDCWLRNGDEWWRRMVASMGDERWTQEGPDVDSPSGVLAALCQRTDR